MGAPAGLRDTASASERFARPWRSGQHGLKWRTALPCPSGSRSAWQVWGTATPANPGRRGSRGSGQTANMVLLVIQIETCTPEQRIGAAAEPRHQLGRTGRRQ